jgi:hypothetical protein
MAKASGAPGPTPDPALAPPPVRAGVDEDARSTSSNASGANDGWLDSLWRKTQKDAEETIKFIEEEHKKNVQKFEQGLNEIKTTAEELADGFTSQLEGRKSLKVLREEVAAAEAVTAAAQVKLVAASKETQLAEEALRDATAKGARASGEVLTRAKAARSSLLLARSEFSASRAETSRREDAVRAAEVALAASAEKRNLMHMLFKRKLTPEEEEEQRLLLEESRRLKAVISIQRNFRAARAKRLAAERAAERRRKLRASCVRFVKTILSFFALYVFLVIAARGAGRAFNARHAAFARAARSAESAARAARARSRRWTTGTCAGGSRPGWSWASTSCFATGTARSATAWTCSSASSPAPRRRWRRRTPRRRAAGARATPPRGWPPRSARAPPSAGRTRCRWR